MEVVYRRCCGLDVHKQTVVACLLLLDEAGRKTKKKREFGTFSDDLRRLMLWLFSNHVTHVAMESTGVYWKPVWNVLEDKFTILLVNPQHMKALPGRKTDQKDSEWIAELLQHGLLRASFIPAREIRELRDLTRLRVHLKQEVNGCGTGCIAFWKMPTSKFRAWSRICSASRDERCWRRSCGARPIPAGWPITRAARCV